MQEFIRKYIHFIVPIIGTVIFFGGIAVGKYAHQPAAIAAPVQRVLREGGYKYINPVLLCNTNTERDDNKDVALTGKLQSYIEQSKNKNISVYFLNLGKSKWAGVGESQTYTPASMLKVPTMVAILKYIESHEELLSKEVLYKGDFDDNKAEFFQPKEAIQPGHAYSVDQLLQYMVQNSDNNATRLLHEVIDERALANIYINLGLQIPTAGADFMSPKTYSLFLRLLYNSTYLTRAMSEKAVELMVESNFSPGLRGGVPESVEVAQKFGERQMVTDDGTVTSRELHDCGIIYSPTAPYILCVMSRGDDFDTLATQIREISQLVYDQVNSN